MYYVNIYHNCNFLFSDTFFMTTLSCLIAFR